MTRLFVYTSVMLMLGCAPTFAQDNSMTPLSQTTQNGVTAPKPAPSGGAPMQTTPDKDSAPTGTNSKPNSSNPSPDGR
jgi:hypothetical protein